MNVDKKLLLEDLFKGGEEGRKRTLEEIRSQVQHYEQTYYEIMTCSEDEVDFRIYRVMAKKLKAQLSEQAKKTKLTILDAVYQYCNDTVNEVNKGYLEMQNKITANPTSEKEMVFTRDYINGSAAMVEKFTEILKEVYRHYMLLEEYSYMYKDIDIERYWYMRTWPLKI